MSRLDEEVEGRKGTTVSRDALREEADPGNCAQSPSDARAKLAAEKEKEGGGITGAVKAFVHHTDRELGGEYERREDPTAPRAGDAVDEAQQPGGAVDEAKRRDGDEGAR